MKTLTHIRTVKYLRVKCPVCNLNILQRWRYVLREDHYEVPVEEVVSANKPHINERVERPLEEFNRYTSVFYCKECGSKLHHSVINKVDRPEDAKEITLFWAANQVVQPS